MSLTYQSFATIKSPEFINLQPLDINPLMSSCDIKVLYLGENRNRSFISKQVATQMAKTLRGAPIVGYFKKEKDDFRDHGQEVKFDGDGITINTLTKPYGFVSPDAKVWFKEFEDHDEFGNVAIRTYLMTTGYLWTGQFEEARKIYEDNGKPHSMELDEDSLQGKWSTNFKQNMEFFIINDAVFSKLCILGDDVEPCFEGSSITPSEGAKTSFSLDGDFTKSLSRMMKELQFALHGGKEEMADVIKTAEEVTVNFSAENKDNKDQSSFEENKITTEGVENTFVKKEEDKEEDKKEESKDSEKKDSSSDKEEENKGGEDKKEKEEKDDKDKKKYSALKADYENLKNQFSTLESEISALRQFKENVENKEKDALISEFSMLSEEDKKDVIENKSKYTLDEIKSKLAVICFDKKVNFNLDSSDKNDEKIESVTTYDLKDTDSTPEWVKAVEAVMAKSFE